MINGKVALFIPALNGGGAEKMMINLVKRFLELGIDCDLVVGNTNGPYKKLLSSDMNVIDLNVNKGLNTLPGFVRYIRKAKPGIILSALETSNLVSLWAKILLKRNGLQVYISERNHVSTSAKNATRIKEKLFPLFLKRFYPAADGIITVSNGVADDLKTIIPKEAKKMVTIYNPVVTKEIINKSNDPLEFSIFKNRTKPVIISVGRLVPQKDYCTLIKAFEKVKQKLDANLLILGEGPERKSIESLVVELGLEDAVYMPGFVDNPYKYIKNSSCFVLSSAWEGFGNVLVEAMACGTPVISTNCPSGPSEILEDGKYGALVPVKDYENLADSIINTLKNPIKSNVLMERANSFTLEAIADQYLTLLSSKE
jgi:glycosyltransferase involved in cell wall biosynthesis